jgi:tetratricopeptide (TPR) repeat protein
MVRAVVRVVLTAVILWASAACSPAAPPQDAEFTAAIQAAREVAKEGHFDRAVVMSKELAERYPDHVDVWVLLGASNYAIAYGLPNEEAQHIVDADATAQALKAFDAGLKIDPAHWLMRLMQARILSDSGRHEEAIPHFRRAFSSFELRTHPRHRYQVTAYAASLAAVGRIDEAQKELRRFLEANKYDKTLMASYYVFVKEHKGIGQAREVLAELVVLSPDLEDVQDAECYLNRLAQLYENARLCYERLALDTNKQARYRIEAFGTLVNLGLHADNQTLAIKYGKQGLAAFPGESYLHYQLGHAQYNDGRYAEAEKSYRQGLELQRSGMGSRDYYARLALGDTYWQLGRLDAAERVYRELETALIPVFRETARERRRVMYEKKPTGIPIRRPEAWENWQ